MDRRNSGQHVAAYVPFSTFLTALDHLRAIEIPRKIDRAVFPSFSGIVRGQILGAFRFLDLIDESGTPKPLLASLAKTESRKQTLAQVLKKQYADVIKLDLSRASPSDFERTLSTLGVSGVTHKKARSFFLKAAQFADIPLSPLLARKIRRVAGKRKKPRKNDARNNPISPASNGSFQIHPDDKTKTITLRSGGKLTLSVSLSWMNIEAEDRELVFAIIDLLKDYERRASRILEVDPS